LRRMFENRVLRRMFGTKREETTRGRRNNCHNGDLHNFYSYHHQINEVEMGRGFSTHEMRNSYTVLMRKPIGRPWSSCEDNMSMNLKRNGYEDVD